MLLFFTETNSYATVMTSTPVLEPYVHIPC